MTVVIGREQFHPLLELALKLLPWLAGIALYCVGVGLVVIHAELRPLDWGPCATLVNSLIVGLLLGFRNRLAYDRWWEARRLWGQLVNDTRNLAAKLSAAVPADVLARDRVPQLLAGFARALKLHLRGGVRLHQIAGFEKDPDDPAHVPQYLAARLLRSLLDWRRDGLLDTSTALVLDVHARALLDVCGACERIRGTPIAGSYVALLRLGLAVNVLTAPWYTLPELGYWGIPALLIVFYFLLGIEVVDTMIEDPFGTERDDLALERYCQTIDESVAALLAPAQPAAACPTPAG
jgi:putative membrane protein